MPLYVCSSFILLNSDCLFLTYIGLFLTQEYAMQRKLASPGFQVEDVLADYDGSSLLAKPKSETVCKASDGSSGTVSTPEEGTAPLDSN